MIRPYALKALSGTNKQISTTQKSLKDVEKLLKMDPGNMELLAQKQRLLGDAVEGTKEKLKTLQEAAKSADDALARGQAYEAKYTPLKEEIDQVSKTLDGLRDNQKRMEEDLASGKISTDTYDAFQKKVSDTEKKLEDLKQAQKDVEEEFKGAKLDQNQYDTLQRELIETEEAAKNAEKAFRNFNETSAEISASATKVAEGASKVADATKGISAAAAAGAAGLVTMATKAALAADDLNTLSKQSGFSTEELQKWTYASDLVDVSVDSIISSARKMKKNMVSESADTVAAWQQLGIVTVTSSGQVRDATEVFYQTLDALSKIPSETERDILAMQLFGKSADELAGIIDDGGAALRALGQEAEDAGLILSQDALDGANAFNDGLDRLKAQANAAFMESGAALAENLVPALDTSVEALGELLKWFASIDGDKLALLMEVLLAVAAIAPIAATIAAIASAIAKVSQIVGILTGALGALNLAGGATLLVFGKWVLLIGAVVAAVWLLVQAFNALTGASKNVEGVDVSGITSNDRGGGSGSRSISATSLDIPHLATGTVARRNNPFLAVVGDNPQEDEIISPYSTIKQAAMEAIRQSGMTSGGSKPQNITMTLDGRTVARLLMPYLNGETNRLGVQLAPK